MDQKLHHKDLGQLTIQPGITEKQIDQLIKHTNSDEIIHKYTFDLQRFKNKQDFLGWKEKNRTIYTLTNSPGDLLGIVWFGPKEIPKDKIYIHKIQQNDYSITFAVRIYKKARGKGLAKNFILECFNKYNESEEFTKLDKKKIWLETYAGNLPAVHIYHKFGFEQVTEPDENNKVIMVLRNILHE